MQIQATNSQNFKGLNIDINVRPRLQRQLLRKLNFVPERISELADKIKMCESSNAADLVVKATGDVYVIKKGQFLSGEIVQGRTLREKFLAGLEKVIQLG